MRDLIIPACLLFLTACQQIPTAATDPTPQAQAGPSQAVAPDPAPSPSPMASPSPSPTPTPTPVQTDTYNGYTCEAMSDGTIQCTGGFTTSPTAGFLSVAVGNGVACGYQDGSGSPVYCSNDTTGANCYSDAAVYCWNTASPVLTLYKPLQNFPAWTPTSRFQFGPVSLSRNGSAQVCVLEDIFDNNTSPAGNLAQQNLQTCGTQVTAQGGLQ